LFPNYCGHSCLCLFILRIDLNCELTLRVVEMHRTPAAVSRSLTIAQLTGARPSHTSQSTIATQQPTSRRAGPSSNHLHSTDSVSGDTRPGPRHGRTVVQMLQDSLAQKAQNQEVATSSSSSSNCSKVARNQTSKFNLHIQ